MCYTKNMFLKIWQNLQEKTCVGVSFLINLLSFEYCEICKNNYFEEHLSTDGSERLTTEISK